MRAGFHAHRHKIPPIGYAKIRSVFHRRENSMITRRSYKVMHAIHAIHVRVAFKQKHRVAKVIRKINHIDLYDSARRSTTVDIFPITQ
jgi:hypothetical protein